MVSPFVGRIQIPLAQPLEHASLFLLQHLSQESPDLIDPAAPGQGDACAEDALTRPPALDSNAQRRLTLPVSMTIIDPGKTWAFSLLMRLVFISS